MSSLPIFAPFAPPPLFFFCPLTGAAMSIFFSLPNSGERATFFAAFTAACYEGPPLADVASRRELKRKQSRPTYDMCPPLTPFLIPMGFLLSLLDALFGGSLLHCMGAVMVNGRQVLATREKDGTCVFRTPEVYKKPMFGPREAAMRFMQKRIALLSGFFGLVILGGWAVLLTSLPAFPSKVLIVWLAQFLITISEGVLKGDVLLSGTFMLVITLFFSYGLIVVMLTAKFSSSTTLGLNNFHLPSVLRLLVHTNAPTLMVSYSWASSKASTAARSLAFALPDSWVDVKCLSAGTDISGLTRNLSAHAEAFVFFLTPEYLQSEACMAELGAALLSRKAEAQHTIAFVVDPLCPKSNAAAAMLQRAGCLVFSEPRELLSHLNQHVYSSTTPEDIVRCSNFLAESSIPNRFVPRSFRLPAPFTKQQQGAIPNCCGRWLPPKGSIFSGSMYISPGADAIGGVFVVKGELLLVLAIAVCYIGLFACLGLRSIYLVDNPLYCKWLTDLTNHRRLFAFLLILHPTYAHTQLRALFSRMY